MLHLGKQNNIIVDRDNDIYTSWPIDVVCNSVYIRHRCSHLCVVCKEVTLAFLSAIRSMLANIYRHQAYSSIATGMQLLYNKSLAIAKTHIIYIYNSCKCMQL